MPVEFGMSGDPAAELKKLAKDLKAAGNKDLRKELLEAGKRLKPKWKDAVTDRARSDLPSSGGLNDWVAGRLSITAQTKLTGRDVGVRFKTKRRGKGGLSDLSGINRGRTRAPLFGDRDHWYLHPVPPGFADRAMEDMRPAARLEFLEAVDAVAKKFAAGG
jgi:hypothetical protein